MINGVTNADALPALEQLMQFSGRRHRIIANNIANLSTPDYRPVDLSVEGFRKQLADAIDRRRAQHGSTGGPLEMRTHPARPARSDTADALEPEAIGDNLLFHDRNDRDLERTMQALVENFMTFRSAAELLRSRFDLINSAIRERI